MDSSGARPQISITPTRQVLHGPSQLRVSIHDPEGDLIHYELSVLYNGFEVSPSFIQQSRLMHRWKERKLVIENPVVRLPAAEDQRIEFVYRNAAGSMAYVKYESPVCYALRPQRVRTTGGFKPPRTLVAMIAEMARREGLNPAFLTGLIAQESRFNPRAVSYVPALGLTQVTALAEQEVVREHPDWPRYPGVDEIDPSVLRVLVSSGHIHAKNEWRLDPKLSLQGGAAYLRLLAQRWSAPANQARLEGRFADSELVRTQLLLASYHSGYQRVSNALERLGKDWLKSRDLREARKYVNRVFSYCNFFVESEV